MTNSATNTQRVIKTNGNGIYDLPALPPGNYTLKVEMPGFGAQIRNDIELQVAQVARIDIIAKAQTQNPIRMPGRPEDYYSDSLVVTVALRNRS